MKLESAMQQTYALTAGGPGSGRHPGGGSGQAKEDYQEKAIGAHEAVEKYQSVRNALGQSPNAPASSSDDKELQQSARSHAAEASTAHEQASKAARRAGMHVLSGYHHAKAQQYSAIAQGKEPQGRRGVL